MWYQTSTRQKKTLLLKIALLVIILLVSCGKTVEPSVNQGGFESPTLTPAPTQQPDRVVLVVQPEKGGNEVSKAEILLRELAAESNLEFEIRQQIIANEVSADVKVVVFLDHPENLGSLSANAPGTQFIAITDQEWNPTANITIIRKREDHQAFIAGYLAAMLAPNFRVGTLLTSEDTVFNQSFVSGVQYYCGICAAVIFPLNTYPQVRFQAADSLPETWQLLANELNAEKVNVLFITEQAYSAELFNYLGRMDTALIGNQQPPAEGEPKWVATILLDAISPIREVWNDVVSGNGGKILNADIQILNNRFVNLQEGLAWLSEGKQNQIEQVIGLLRKEYISPLPIP